MIPIIFICFAQECAQEFVGHVADEESLPSKFTGIGPDVGQQSLPEDFLNLIHSVPFSFSIPILLQVFPYELLALCLGGESDLLHGVADDFQHSLQIFLFLLTQLHQLIAYRFEDFLIT